MTLSKILLTEDEVNLPKVLLVEDDKHIQIGWHGELGAKLRLFSAFTLDEARTTFRAHSDWAAIVMDGTLGSGPANTPPLVREIRQSGFGGIIIAVSILPESNRALRKAGCSHESRKDTLPDILLELLGLPPIGVY